METNSVRLESRRFGSFGEGKLAEPDMKTENEPRSDRGSLETAHAGSHW